MLGYWKRRLGLSNLPASTADASRDAMDLKLLDDIRLWYAGLLEDAPAGMLPTSDLADVAYAVYTGSNSAEVYLPEEGIRFVELKLECWSRPVFVTHSPYSDEARMQHAGEAAATTEEPLIVAMPGRLRVYGVDVPAGASPRAAGNHSLLPPQRPRPDVERLEMVVYPGEGVYTLDERLLRTSVLEIH